MQYRYEVLYLCQQLQDIFATDAIKYVCKKTSLKAGTGASAENMIQKEVLN